MYCHRLYFSHVWGTIVTQPLEWPISNRIAALGYKRQDRETLISIGAIAGRLYKQRHGCNPPKREQYVDGTTGNVNCYGSADLDIVDQVIRAKLGESPSNDKNLPLAQ